MDTALASGGKVCKMSAWRMGNCRLKVKLCLCPRNRQGGVGGGVGYSTGVTYSCTLAMGAISSNENGAKVTLRGVHQAKTVGKCLWSAKYLEA